MTDLVTADSDWADFQSGTPAWFLSAAGAAIRKYCAWDIYPSATVTVDKLQIGGDGIIMLPSMHVTAVASVAITHPTGNAHVLDASTYTWTQNGVIQRAGVHWWWAGWASYYGGALYSSPFNCGTATVTFTGGYTTLPADVKEVAFELAAQAAVISNGNLTSIESPNYKVQLSQPAGLSLNSDQKNRLANYRRGGIG